MVGRRRGASQGRHGTSRRVEAPRSRSDVYSEMLAEAGVVASNGVSTRDAAQTKRPLKRQKPSSTAHASTSDRHGQGSSPRPAKAARLARHKSEETPRSSESEEEVEFQDVVIPEATMQTMDRDSASESDDEEDLEFENVDFTALTADLDKENGGTSRHDVLELSLDMSKSQIASPDRRKPLTKEQKRHRQTVHMVHLLCLLMHVHTRNHWCNDPEAQNALSSVVDAKAHDWLHPPSHLSQFGRTESFKKGLHRARDRFEASYDRHFAKGLWRARWAESLETLDDSWNQRAAEQCLDVNDFRKTAKSRQGSRDLGAQLFCALLRGAGVRARLVCSLQPLPLESDAPTMPATPSPSQKRSNKSTPTGRKERFTESKHPVYWVEALDVGYQKWRPVSPHSIAGNSLFWEPRQFEPALHETENRLSYVIAFEADGSAKDVTKRYAKAYNAKTRKMRVDSGVVEGGEAFWRTTLGMFRNRSATDLDQIEDNELQAAMEKEPTPKNIQDYKDHPLFALERHLRRNEVLDPNAVPSGTVQSGKNSAVERVYRRKHILVGRTVDKWFRLGREVKPNEIPVKWLPKKRVSKVDSDDEDAVLGSRQPDLNGQPLYTHAQTELYVPPRVRNGRVPKNQFGNIEVYVPSMIPRGGRYLLHPLSKMAAHLLGVDYAPALTGFSFSGRRGTAVLTGIVVAEEVAEAVQATIAGLQDLQEEEEERRRRRAVLKVWKRWLMGLRIREGVWEGADEQERREAEREVDLRLKDQGYEDDGGGGFVEDAEQARRGGDDDGAFERWLRGDGRDEDEGIGGGFIADAAAEDIEGGGGFMAATSEVGQPQGHTATPEQGDKDMTFQGRQSDQQQDTQRLEATLKQREDVDRDNDGEHGQDTGDASDATEEYDMVVDEDDDMGGGFLVD